MKHTRAAIEAIVDEGAIPSLSVHVRAAGRDRLSIAQGAARLDPHRPATIETAYDLASVTKVVGTLPVVAALIDSGDLDLDAPVCATLPEVDRRITARHLLSHGSGYPAWAPLYKEVGDWGSAATRATVMERAWTTPLAQAPGQAHVYSDLGYITLCALLEELGQDRLDAQLAPQLATLQADLRWGWPGAAATEDCPVRSAVVEGEVHDLNCASMGGVSTHAGLFGTAGAVGVVAQALLDALEDRGPLPCDAVRALAASQGPGSHRLGFDSISAGYTSTGSHFPADTLGHLGYTGTSVWIVPSRDAVVVVLSNRVHPIDDLTAIRAARPRIHDAIARDLGWV